MAAAKMNLARPRLAVFALLAGAARLVAQDGGEPKVTADFGYVSRYVFRGIERAGSSAQASVEYAADGFRGRVWTSRPLHRGESGETDLTAAYGRQVGEKLNVELALTGYRFTRPAAGAAASSVEATLSATFASVGGVTPSIAVRRDFRLEADSVQASFAYSVALPQLGAFLELGAFAGWSDARNARPDAAGPRAGDGYGYGGGEARIPYRVGAHTTVIAGVQATTTVGRGPAWPAAGRPARSNLWLTLGVSFDF
ncbi:MAG: hypothetical protein HY302_15295 [Opitutae bacterium]|nr:hypothetical protein [Opitutae bacterium]